MGEKLVRCPQGHLYPPARFSTCPFCLAADLDGWTSRPPQKPNEPHYEPVVGWLVCIEGKEYGKDYKIKAEGNWIGRDREMDIFIPGDDRISRHRHAKLNFDPESNEFSILPEEAGGNVYLNGRNVMEAKRLKAGDRLKLGDTVLLFVPLCGETFSWETEARPDVPSNELPRPEE